MNRKIFLNNCDCFHFLYQGKLPGIEFGYGNIAFQYDEHLLHFIDHIDNTNDAVWSRCRFSVVELKDIDISSLINNDTLKKLKNNIEQKIYAKIILLSINEYIYYLDSSKITNIINGPFVLKELKKKIDTQNKLLSIDFEVSYSKLHILIFLESMLDSNIMNIFHDVSEHTLYIKKFYKNLHKLEDISKKDVKNIKKSLINKYNHWNEGFISLHSSLTSKTYYCQQHIDHEKKKLNDHIPYNCYYMNNAINQFSNSKMLPIWIRNLLHIIKDQYYNVNNKEYDITEFLECNIKLVTDHYNIILNNQYDHQETYKLNVLSNDRLQYLLNQNEKITDIMYQQILNEILSST